MTVIALKKRLQRDKHAPEKLGDSKKYMSLTRFPKGA